MWRPAAFAALCTVVAAAPLGAQRRVVADLSFELDRNRAIVRVHVGGATPLRMILDSGMPYDGILVFDSAKVDLTRLAGLAPSQIAGAGEGAPSTALTDSAGSFAVGGLRFSNQRITVLLSDRMRGVPTDGVIGYSLLGHYAVELDYDRGRLVLYEASSFVADSGWQSIALRFRENQVPWVDIAVSSSGEQPARLAAYIDCAAGSALELLQRDVNRFVLPTTTGELVAGRGLSGDVRGKSARVSSLRLGPFALTNVTTLVVPAAVRSRQAGADAVIGNDVLRRFNVVFDYAHHKLHLKPNQSFAAPFR